MGKPIPHLPVKLIAGLISGHEEHFSGAKRVLEKKFGETDFESPLIDFSPTRYYEKEMGAGLMRKFLSFRKPVALKGSYKIKLFTNAVEKKLSGKAGRVINIDPGYLTLSNLILFTTKNRSHRIYLDRGIYAEVELEFSQGTFRPLPSTYPDYRTESYIDFFNSVRKDYAERLKERRGVDIGHEA